MLNFKPEIKLASGTHYPSLVEASTWAMTPALTTMMVIGVRLVGDMTYDGLAADPLSGTVSLTGAEIREQLRREAPPDGREIHDWMHDAGGANMVATARSREYAEAGGELLYNAGDAYVPGVTIGNYIRFRSEPAIDVGRRGYAIALTRRGSYRVPVPGATKIIERDLLAWAAVLSSYVKQWVGVLLHYRKLPKNPRRRIASPAFYTLVAPLYIHHEASIPAPVNLVSAKISVPSDATVTIRGLDVNDYTREHWKREVKLAKGQNAIDMIITGIPYVPTLAIEIASNTPFILDEWRVYP